MIRKIFAAIWIFVTALLFILANGREAPSAQTPDDDTKANAEILQHVQSFVFRHPKIGLHGIIPNIESQWDTLTQDIRSGRLPSRLTCVRIEAMVMQLRVAEETKNKAFEEQFKDLGLKVPMACDSHEWRGFLAMLKYIKH